VIILDTNIVSELMTRAPHSAVRGWLNHQAREDLVTTTITVMELRAGIEKLLHSHRRTRLEAEFDWVVDDLLGGRVLNFDRRAAHAAATWHARCRREGRPVQTTDVQIAGIAIARRIPLATRDTDHFEDLDVKVIDPWAAAT
jgi:predicted nucleic acid-binding protein